MIMFIIWLTKVKSDATKLKALYWVLDYLVFFSCYVVILFILPAVFIAWRWVLTTATIFGALVAVNYAYVLWLAPLAEHH